MPEGNFGDAERQGLCSNFDFRLILGTLSRHVSGLLYRQATPGQATQWQHNLCHKGLPNMERSDMTWVTSIASEGVQVHSFLVWTPLSPRCSWQARIDCSWIYCNTRLDIRQYFSYCFWCFAPLYSNCFALLYSNSWRFEWVSLLVTFLAYDNDAQIRNHYICTFVAQNSLRPRSPWANKPWFPRVNGTLVRLNLRCA